MAVMAEERIGGLLDRIRAFMRDGLYPLETRLLREGFGALLLDLHKNDSWSKSAGGRRRSYRRSMAG